MKKFFKKLLTSGSTHAILLGATAGFGLMFILTLAIPALSGLLGFALGATFVSGVAYALTKYAEFRINAKEGEKLLGTNGGEAGNEDVNGEEFVLTQENEATQVQENEVVAEAKIEEAPLTPEEQTRKKIEKYSVEMDEMGKF